MSFLDNGIIKIGVNLNLGGSITYLADSKLKDNLVNNYDWGRQIQMSFYSGPNPYTANGKKQSPDWIFLGWNPIQSGDYAGYAARILEHKNDGKKLYVKGIPMQWPLDSVPCECTFETWIELDSNRVKVKSKINNNREDKTQYSGRHQELPAILSPGNIQGEQTIF